ncbi:MAG TPA: GMP/IMP nucleotidase [Cellvibrionaceae bacterium]|nr:GMP/IMP nucleotidase [Cellvibrionaceae bacterium]
MIPWQAIDTLLLDMDGTLLDLHYDNYFWLEHLPRAFASKNALDLATAKTQIESKIKKIEGTLQWYCLDYWSDILDLDITALKRQITSKIALHSTTLDFLQAAKAQQKTLILATNAHRASLEIKMHSAGIEHFFDALVSSHDYQAPKESAIFWQAITAQFNLNPARCLFVDDTPRILHAAQNFGIGHLVHINQPDSQQNANPCSDFLSLPNFASLLPSLNAGGQNG